MWIDLSISAALAVVAIVMGYLGVHVTLHAQDAPAAQRAFRAAFIFCALLSVSLVAYQGVRNGATLNALASAVHRAEAEAQGANQRIDNLTQQAKIEAARREQAERDLALTVQATMLQAKTAPANALQATMQSARQVVSPDIRQDIQKPPIQAAAKPPAARDPQKLKEIRNKLGELLERNEILRSNCNVNPVPDGFSCFSSANDWAKETTQYIAQNMDASYKARFLSASGQYQSYDAAGSDQTRNSAINYLVFKAAALAEFIEEQR